MAFTFAATDRKVTSAAANNTAAADLSVVTATPLETAEGSDEIRFAVIAGAVVAGGIGIWYWMRTKKKGGKRGRRRARGFLL